jgi:hypothetical protein
MNLSHPVLADFLDDNERIIFQNMARSGWSQFSIIVGSLILVGLIIFAFAFLFRRRLMRKRRRRHHHHDPVTDAITSAVTVTSKDSHGHRKKRRLRRAHRPVNPTLAQTHGLPPVRDPDTPPPGA